MRQHNFGQEKARVTSSGSNQKFNNAGGTIKRFDVFNFRGIATLRQCTKCGSDYLRFAVNGFCQDCLQRAEFVVREHPHVAARAMGKFEQAGGGFHK